MKTLIPAAALQSLPAASQALLLGKSFFPNLISAPFDDGLRIAFSISVALSVVAAFASLLRGKRYINRQANEPVLEPPQGEPLQLLPSASEEEINGD
jgi:hypothetical protein